MKAALLISGYLRTINLNLDSIKTRVLNKFDSCDVYLHITKNERIQDRSLNLVDDKTIKEVIEFLKPVAVLYEENIHYSNSNEQNVLLNTWMKFQKLNQIKQINGISYDVVIKIRPDCNLLSDVDFNLAVKNPNKIYLPLDDKVDISKLVSTTDPHICDIFAFGSNSAMNSYFPTLQDIKNCLREVGSIPETFLAYHLQDYDVEKLDIEYGVLLSSCNIFAIAGDSGSGKSTLADLLKAQFKDSFLLECDRYHKWERGNDMWKKLTHLNPGSNFLTKMQEDIFDLKVGKTIFQVDYDHKNGKFTEKETIPSKDHIIVCGLHSLYLQDDTVYNLKIFMDTDIALKYKWKIKRDIQKRGYTPEQIIKQIESRAQDYKNYIEPQKYQSDIVVNFYTDHVFSLETLDQTDNVGLILTVNKKYDLSFVASNLKQANVDFVVETNEVNNVVAFPMQQENQETINQFYSYVSMVVFGIQNQKIQAPYHG